MKIIQYIFNSVPGSEFRFYIPLAVLIFLLFAASITISIIYKSRKSYDFAFKRLFRKTSFNLSLFGILFLFLIAMRYEGIPYFAMRLWLFLSIIWLAYFIGKTIKVWKKDYPRERENVKNLSVNSQNKTVNRYTPNKHKK